MVNMVNRPVKSNMNMVEYGCILGAVYSQSLANITLEILITLSTG